MDANKLVVLKDIGYTVQPTCGNCIHANIARGSKWGTCNIHTYLHQKHTGEERQLSINVSGRCQEWENEGLVAELEGFAQLLEEIPEKYGDEF
jgi:hypothetical protein